jgi:hypothetical protein
MTVPVPLPGCSRSGSPRARQARARRAETRSDHDAESLTAAVQYPRTPTKPREAERWSQVAGATWARERSRESCRAGIHSLIPSRGKRGSTRTDPTPSPSVAPGRGGGISSPCPELHYRLSSVRPGSSSRFPPLLAMSSCRLTPILRGVASPGARYGTGARCARQFGMEPDQALVAHLAGRGVATSP